MATDSTQKATGTVLDSRPMRTLLVVMALAAAACFAGMLLVLMVSEVLPREIEWVANRYVCSFVSVTRQVMLGVLVFVPAIIVYCIMALWTRAKGERGIALWRMTIFLAYLCTGMAVFYGYMLLWLYKTPRFGHYAACAASALVAILLMVVTLKGLLRFARRNYTHSVAAAITGMCIAAVPVVLYAWLMLHLSGLTPQRSIPCAMTALLAIVGCMLAVAAGCGGHRGFHAAGWAYVVGAWAMIAWLAWDAPPTMRHVRADLPVPKLHASESRAAQMSLTKHEFSSVFRSQVPCTSVWPYISNVPTNVAMDYVAFRHEIEHAWAHSVSSRTLLATLAGYDGIADVATNLMVPRPHIVEQMKATHLACAYGMLKAQKGDAVQAAGVLAVHYDLARKALPYAASVMNKKMWMAVSEYTIMAAYAVAGAPTTSTNALHVMKARFMPLQPDAMVLAPCMMGEMVMADELSRAVQDNPANVLRDMSNLCARTMPVVRLFVPLVLNRNATMRDIAHLYEAELPGLRRVPMTTSVTRSDLSERHFGVQVKNVLGTSIAARFLSDLPTLVRRANKCLVWSDLLAIRIAQRLGESSPAADRFSGTPYLIDPAGEPYSAGPDKIPGTDDDICIPNVLQPNLAKHEPTGTI